MPEINFTGPAGRLEGRFQQVDLTTAPTAIFLHHHPKFGGTMNNKVIYYLFYKFAEIGFTVLRFNFRGVGRSQGKSIGDIGELADATAALDFLQSKYPNSRKCWVIGFSYGAFIAMQLMTRRPEITEFVAVAPAVDMYDFGFLSPCTPPGMIIHGSKDTIAKPHKVEALAAKIIQQKGSDIEYRMIEGAGHFFDGPYMQQLTSSVAEYAEKRLSL